MTKTVPAKTAAERKADERIRRREAGESEITAWVPTHHVGWFRDTAKAACDGASLPGEPVPVAPSTIIERPVIVEVDKVVQVDRIIEVPVKLGQIDDAHLTLGRRLAYAGGWRGRLARWLIS